MIRKILLGFTFIALASSGSISPLWAQDQEAEVASSEESTPLTQVDRVSQLLDSIGEIHGELVRLIGDVPDAEGEDLQLLRAQIDEMAEKQHAELLKLVGIIQDDERIGGRFTLLEQRTKQALQRSSRLLRGYILDLHAALATEATRRTSLTSSELQVFEHEMSEDTTRLDRYYLGLIQLTDTMMALGLSIEEEQDFLSRRLTERGQNLLRLLELTNKQLEEYRELLKKDPEDAELQAKVFSAEERFDSNKTSLLTTIHLMKTLGLDFTELEVRTLELTGEVTPEALEIEVALGLLGRGLDRTRTYLADNGTRILVRLLTIVGIVLVFWIAARLARSVTTKVLNKTKISTSKLLKEMVVSMMGRVVLIVGFIVVLSQMGINLGPILAGLGIAGFIVGFALQDTLSNFAAGAMILAYRPFDVGDLVEAAGVTGRVHDMNLVSTRILTIDHQTLIVPNRKIWGDVIRNVTAQPTRRVDMVFGISYEDEIPKAEKVLEEIVEAHPKVLADPEPVVKVHTLNDSSVDFVVRPWATTDDYWDVYWDVTREVKMRFDKEGISIPYPQRDVHIIAQESSEETA